MTISSSYTPNYLKGNTILIKIGDNTNSLQFSTKESVIDQMLNFIRQNQIRMNDKEVIILLDEKDNIGYIYRDEDDFYNGNNIASFWSSCKLITQDFIKSMKKKFNVQLTSEIEFDN